MRHPGRFERPIANGVPTAAALIQPGLFAIDVIEFSVLSYRHTLAECTRPEWRGFIDAINANGVSIWYCGARLGMLPLFGLVADVNQRSMVFFVDFKAQQDHEDAQARTS